MACWYWRAIALPGSDEGNGLVLRSDAPGIVPPALERVRLVVSRTRPAKEVVAVADALDAEIIVLGSAGAGHGR